MRFKNALSIILTVALLLQGLHAADAQTPIRVRSGLISGTRDGELAIYRGIPYAAPPVGDLRWKPPQPAPRWDGVREATTFGLPCAQSALLLGRAVRAWSEDCLTLNVWAPLETPAKPLPVLVVIPGGGFFAGGATERVNDGAEFAKRGIVVVSMNYRLGVFGFFAHPMLSKESRNGASGNYGLMDQIAALKWVRDNIAVFGGDPGNVTITGSSAGGSSVLYLLVSPLATGLFERAIAESPALVYGPLAHLTEHRYGRDAREAQGVRLGEDIAGLRALPATELQARAALQTNFMFAEGPDYWPMVDGAVLPDEPSVLFDGGKFARVPLLLGTAENEGSLFALLDSMQSRAAWADHLARRHPGAEAVVQAAYPIVSDTDFYHVGMQWVNDWYFHGSTRAVARAVAARGVPVYLFSFSRAAQIPPIRGRTLGAAHSLETQYVFARFEPNAALTETDRELSRIMGMAWAEFVKTGNPNTAGLPTWPRYDRSRDQHLDFGTEIRVGTQLHAKSLDAFDSAFTMMRSYRAQRPK